MMSSSESKIEATRDILIEAFFKKVEKPLTEYMKEYCEAKDEKAADQIFSDIEIQ